MPAFWNNSEPLPAPGLPVTAISNDATGSAGVALPANAVLVPVGEGAFDVAAVNGGATTGAMPSSLWTTSIVLQLSSPANGLSLPAAPPPTSLVSTPDTVTVLSTLVASPPPAVAATWGMVFSFTPTALAAPQPPTTLFAAANTPPPGTVFTAVGIAGADRALGKSNVAPAVPAIWSSIIVDYSFKGVSAGQSAIIAGIDIGPDPLTDPMTNVVVKVCFAAGTPILMADGTTKPIEQIKVGDRVQSAPERDPDGAIAAGEVVEVIRNDASPLIAVEVAGQLINATPRHPFYVLGRGFIPAEELSVGDQLRSVSGAPVAVISAFSLLAAANESTPKFAICTHTSWVTRSKAQRSCITTNVVILTAAASRHKAI